MVNFCCVPECHQQGYRCKGGEKATLPRARDVENQSKFPESLSMKIGCCARRAKQVQCCLLTTSASIGVQVNRTVKESREKGTQVDFSLYQKKRCASITDVHLDGRPASSQHCV
ncbi:uncharacterized protein LOC142573142 isoform X4 [Dermacentor variabilis]|uniref:uncharacterized protein LOC142573142 isoform X4 n=1 Tax=Dermacentor variabilis TaxID=34621 RepID=UPI003F5AF84C